jgi:recombination protein RecR
MKSLKSLQALIESFEKLPGVGAKSAERMAHAILDLSDDDIQQFVTSIQEVKSQIKPCHECGMLTESERCEICTSTRPYETLIVVGSSKDVLAFERLTDPMYRYHILGGVLSATKGIGVNHLSIPQLERRLKEKPFQEVILATNPTLDGETTAQYLGQILKGYPVTISRLGYGLPMGGHVDYADAITLGKALGGRTKVKGAS